MKKNRLFLLSAAVLMLAVVLSTALPAGLVRERGDRSSASSGSGLSAETDPFAISVVDGQFLLSARQEGWTVHIAGRVETAELGGMSVHYLEDEDWSVGRTNSFAVPDGCTELTLTAWRSGEELQIDLLSCLPRQTEATG